MANPYNIDFLKNLLGQQETQRLEFKSARDLLNENPQKQTSFIRDKLVPAVSAFLNTDGGVLVIGIEEQNDEAIGISDGVPRSRMTWERLQSAICDRIQPAVASYVSTYCVPVGKKNDESLFLFVVEVKPGTTAYQADDKRYYVRRSGQNEAMEDKDVRLRMLAGDKPKISISLIPRLELSGIHNDYVSSVNLDLRLENSGIRTIPRAIIKSSVIFDGLAEGGARIITSGYSKYRETNFPISNIESTGLFPGQFFETKYLAISSLTFHDCESIDAVSIFAQAVVYIDDGLPAELKDYDLMADVRPVIENGWKAAKD